MSDLPPRLSDPLLYAEKTRLQIENAAMRNLIAKFAQGTYTLRHALTADEIQLMAECADVDKATCYHVQEGVGRELPPTPQPDPKRHACGNVDGATACFHNQRITDIATAVELLARHTVTPHDDIQRALVLRALVGVAIHRDDMTEALELLSRKRVDEEVGEQ